MGAMMGWLAGVGRVESDARHLRELYGAEAEAWCASALAALPAGDPRRRSIQLIAKALHHVPAPTVKHSPRPVDTGLKPSHAGHRGGR